MDDLAGSHILLTGGSGFIGRALLPMLQRAGALVTIADLKPHPDPEVPTVVGDLCDPLVQKRAVTADLDGIIHLAAMTSVLRSRERPAEVVDANVDMTAALLECARELGVSRFLFASTNAVVGDVGSDTITEHTGLLPLTPYGGTKAAAEMLLSAYGASYDMQTCSLRLTNVYGPGMQAKDSFVPRLMRAALSDEAVQIYGDGKQRRDFVYVDDACEAIVLAWRKRQRGPLIVGSGASVTVLDLVDMAREATGAPLPAQHVAPKPGEMPAVIVSIDRARELGYEPDVGLVDGLAAVWADFRSEP